MKYLRLLLLLAFPLANGFLPLSPVVSSPLRPLSVISQNRAINSLNQKSPSTTRVPLHLHSTPEPSNDIDVSNDYSNFPSFLKPLASSIDKSTGGWALSYADCSPETGERPLAQLSTKLIPKVFFSCPRLTQTFLDTFSPLISPLLNIPPRINSPRPPLPLHEPRFHRIRPLPNLTRSPDPRSPNRPRRYRLMDIPLQSIIKSW